LSSILRFKIFIDGNHKPEIRGTDTAIWNRTKLIPFNVSIPESEIDKRLLDKLKAEAAGILAWAVRGCLDWQRHQSLGEPQRSGPQPANTARIWTCLPIFLRNAAPWKPGGINIRRTLWSLQGMVHRAERESLVAESLRLSAEGKGLGTGEKARWRRVWRGITLDGAPHKASGPNEVEPMPDGLRSGLSDRPFGHIERCFPLFLTHEARSIKKI
jgi:putative DNA primase/helicase